MVHTVSQGCWFWIKTWNSHRKIHFRANLNTKIQTCPFCLNMVTHSISRMLIGNLHLDFLIFQSQNPFFDKSRPKNWKLPVLSENWCTYYLKVGESESKLRFFKFRPQNKFFGQLWAQNLKIISFVWKLAHIISQGCWFGI